MVDNLDLTEGSNGWASRPGRGWGRGQRQHRLEIRRERRNAIPLSRKECGLMENWMSPYFPIHELSQNTFRK